MPNSRTAQSDISAENEFHRPVNTEPADTVTNNQNLDQIYTELNATPQRPRPVQIFTSTLHPDQTISSFSNYLRTSDTNPQSSSITITDHQIMSFNMHYFIRHSSLCTIFLSHELNFTSHCSSEQEVTDSSVVIIVTTVVLVLLLIAVSLIIVAVRNKMKNKGLLWSIEEFNPEFYEQIKDAGRHCDPEDRDTITTVFYSFVS
ncbi:hypothetical protein ABG768_001232 [Culter alburnus]|uniref:Uncharacterized protein n=1 Tax=Culter alburnus TaxID=194366 RepID=A0AAW2B8F6_CULAL